jgi:hypothetical protein
MTDVERKVEILRIRFETLVDYLNLSVPHFGPPVGRGDYDAMVKSALEKAGLEEQP